MSFVPVGNNRVIKLETLDDMHFELIDAAGNSVGTISFDRICSDKLRYISRYCLDRGRSNDFEDAIGRAAAMDFSPLCVIINELIITDLVDYEFKDVFAAYERFLSSLGH